MFKRKKIFLQNNQVDPDQLEQIVQCLEDGFIRSVEEIVAIHNELFIRNKILRLIGIGISETQVLVILNHLVAQRRVTRELFSFTNQSLPKQTPHYRIRG